jgi:hypothetical protein
MADAGKRKARPADGPPTYDKRRTKFGINYQSRVDHMAADAVPVGVKWGQKHKNRLHAMSLQHR